MDAEINIVWEFMNIRKYRDGDRELLVVLWNTVFPEDPAHNEAPSVIDAKLAVDDLIFVSESDGKLVGACMAGYDGHRGWLYAVGVLQDYRRSGVGSALVKHAMKSLADLGCVKVNLQIRSTNTEISEFYKALGFKIEDRLSMGALL